MSWSGSLGCNGTTIDVHSFMISPWISANCPTWFATTSDLHAVPLFISLALFCLSRSCELSLSWLRQAYSQKERLLEQDSRVTCSDAMNSFWFDWSSTPHSWVCFSYDEQQSKGSSLYMDRVILPSLCLLKGDVVQPHDASIHVFIHLSDGTEFGRISSILLIMDEILPNSVQSIWWLWIWENFIHIAHYGTESGDSLSATLLSEVPSLDWL